MKTSNNLILTLFVAIVLSACGGGGGGGSGDNRDNSDTNVTTDNSGGTGGTGGTGSASIAWTAPSSRTDSSYLPMAELEGYRIYYGTSADNLSILVDLNDNSITEYTVTNLPSGSYYFTVTAYDSEGLESGFSNILNRDV